MKKTDLRVLEFVELKAAFTGMDYFWAWFGVSFFNLCYYIMGVFGRVGKY